MSRINLVLLVPAAGQNERKYTTEETSTCVPGPPAALIWSELSCLPFLTLLSVALKPLFVRGFVWPGLL